MATIQYWIQIENRPWDVSPKNIDRITGQNLKDREGKDPEHNVQLTSLGTPVATRKTTMFRPFRDSDGKIKDALILRRYKPPKLPDEVRMLPPISGPKRPDARRMVWLPTCIRSSRVGPMVSDMGE